MSVIKSLFFSDAGSEKARCGPSDHRTGDEIQTGGCEAGPEMRRSRRSGRSGNRRIMTSNDDNPLVDGRGGRGAHEDPLEGSTQGGVYGFRAIFCFCKNK